MIQRSNTAFNLVSSFLLLLGCSGTPDEPADTWEGFLGESVGSNLILISVDTLRADRLGLYGYARETTPNLERFAQDAVVFDAFFYNGGGTLPSHMSMMTGLHPRTHWITPHNGRSLEDSRTTLAEALQRDGYATAGFVDGGWMRSKFGFGQGFDSYDDEGGGFEKLRPKVLNWLDAHHDEKFFLFVHTYDVHSATEGLPYNCPGDYAYRYASKFEVDFDGCRDGRCSAALLAWVNSEIRNGQLSPDDVFTAEEVDFISALYDGCINYVDDQIEVILSRLKEFGIYDGSLIVVASDHGEEFLEHGMFLHDQGGYEEYARLPLIVKLPQEIAAGQRVGEMAAMVDLMPTILEVLGTEVPGEAQGRSLLPAIFSGVAVREHVHMYSVLRTRRWKYLSDQKELYDLETDSEERTNLFDAESGRVKDLEKQVRGIISQDIQAYEAFQESIQEEPTDVHLSDEEKKQLKALGYLQ